jgi:hypothetical protein
MTLANRQGNFSGTLQGVRHSSAVGVGGTVLNVDWNHAIISSGINMGRIIVNWDQNSSNGYIASASLNFSINYSPATGKWYLRFMNVVWNDSPSSTVTTSSITAYWFDGTTETLGETGVSSASNYIRFKMTQAQSALAASPATTGYLIREI